MTAAVLAALLVATIAWLRGHYLMWRIQDLEKKVEAIAAKLEGDGK